MFRSLLIPLVLTVVIEELVACLFFRSKNDLLIVLLTQCITNPAINLLIFLFRTNGVKDLMMIIVLLEIMVVIVEMVIYVKNLSDNNKNKSLPLSLVANSVAFLIGLGMNS